MVAALRLLALVAVLAFPAAARADFAPGSESGFDGAVSATLNWTGGPDGPTHTTLTISRGGAVAYSQPVDDLVCATCELDRHSDLFVIDLNGDGEAEVLVTTFTRTSEFCCQLLGVWGRRPDGTYDSVQQNWGDAGYEIADVGGDGVFEVISRDPGFVDVFESGALSYSPAQIVHYGLRRGEPHLFDVTRRYPSEIRRSARHARYVARQLRHHARGYLAAYVADQYLLGQGKTGLRELDREITRGSVGSPASARAYRARLLRFLHQLHYR